MMTSSDFLIPRPFRRDASQLQKNNFPVNFAKTVKGESSIYETVIQIAVLQYFAFLLSSVHFLFGRGLKRAAFDAKAFNDTEVWKSCLTDGNTIINFHRRTNRKGHGYIFD